MPKTKSALDQVLAILSRARRKLQDEAEHLAHQIGWIDEFLGSSRTRTRKGSGKASRAPKRGGKRGISAAGRARISAAQKKRWAVIKAGKKAKGSVKATGSSPAGAGARNRVRKAGGAKEG